jgi:N-acetylmuramoyl-L-alanine amidase
MTTRSTHFTTAVLTVAVLAMLVPSTAWAQSARARYEAAKERDDKVRAALAAAPSSAQAPVRTPIIREARSVISAYEALVRAYRASGYADNALFNAAGIADALHDKFGLTTDRDAALRLYKRLAKEYPTAPLAKQSAADIARLERIAEQRAPIAPAELTASASARESSGELRRDLAAAASGREGGRDAADEAARLLAIERALLPGIVRITLQLDREVRYHEETLTGPARVFFDLQGVEAAPELVDAVLRYPSDVVRQIRTGRHPNATRVVLDLEGVAKHSVYTLYNPFRIVIDAESASARETSGREGGATTAVAATSPAPAPKATKAPPAVVKEPLVVPSVVPAEEAPAASAPVAANTPSAPTAPSAPSSNGVGGFSIARQLGLGVSRIVIDPGHGGHDPGAQARGLNEADLTLDIALRLEKLLQKEPGLEVVLTRRTDVYIPLEERTAIANREGADLFLSIHANTSRNKSARGVETYFLSFAGSADAEAVAARENSAHAGEMHKLPDIIRAITLNNKLDESRDLAGMVQEALVTRLRRSSKAVQNRGVKKAPFVVLIGAEMPSVLAEVSFMSNRQELALLKTAAYKNRIAEALHAAVLRYRRALKGSATAAAQ